jgi:hypothetical protein
MPVAQNISSDTHEYLSPLAENTGNFFQEKEVMIITVSGYTGRQNYQ